MELIFTTRSFDTAKNTYITLPIHNVRYLPDNDAFELIHRANRIKEYILEHKMSINDGLISALEGRQFLLVGEYHTNNLNDIRLEIVKSLPLLKEKGLTHIGLELRNEIQEVIDSLDYTSPTIKDDLLSIPNMYENIIDILIQSKLLGLKVVCLDDGDSVDKLYRVWDLNPNDYRFFNTKKYEKLRNLEGKIDSRRDISMFSTIHNKISEINKMLIFIGNNHVHKKCVEVIGNKPIVRIGTLLTDNYGNDKVACIRYCKLSDSIRGTKNDALRYQNFLSNNQIPIMLPDSGPLEGDFRYYAADYLMVGPK